MAISGQLNINIGLPNESTGSDSLYTAFNKIQDNFSNVFACASPYSNIIAGNGITIDDDSANGNITIDNAGVINIIPSSSISVSDDGFGNITLQIISDGSNIVGGVQSVGLQSASTSRLTVSGASSPIIDSGIFIIDLATSGATAGTYTYPTMTIDSYGRVTSISSGASVGTVTSVGLSPGSGIQITGGPVTTSGTITVTNTGVTSLVAGSGIVLSGSNGAVTVSSPGSAGTVTSVAVTSATLTVSGSPIVESGLINIEVPTNFVSPGNITATGNLNVGVPQKLTIFGANGDIISLGNVQSGGANAIMFANGLITAANISSANDIFVTANANVAGNLRVDNRAVFSNGITLSSNTQIFFTDTSAPTNDTYISYVSSPQKLSFNLNGSERLALRTNDIILGSNVTMTSSNLNTTQSTMALFNGNATSVTAFGAATSLAIGNSSGGGSTSITLRGGVSVNKEFTVGANVQYDSVDVLTNGGTASLVTYATTFAPSTSPITGTLATGTAGQIKTFIMTSVGVGGSMEITVTNAGWKTSGTGTMTFNARGQGCTLQYVSSKWYCVGNNNVVFA